MSTLDVQTLHKSCQQTGMHPWDQDQSLASFVFLKGKVHGLTLWEYQECSCSIVNGEVLGVHQFGVGLPLHSPLGLIPELQSMITCHEYG
jgi:hypothetical protein